MNINVERASAVRNNAIKEYDKYVSEYGILTEDKLFSVPTMVMVGYFLKVHSVAPEEAVRRYLRNHSISYRKANEVKTLIHILEKQ